MKHHYDCIDALRAAGINYEDACALRRISMTLHRWHELECGDSNNYASWCITRGIKHRDVHGKANFTHDENGKPYLERHPYDGMVSYSPVPDRERGALKRLAAIMARYPGFASYVQTDPRGCALYILTSDHLARIAESGSTVECSYNRGIAVYK